MTPSTTTMSRSSQISLDASSDVVSLRNFVVDEDRANLGSAFWKTADKNAFILSQREAIESFNLAKAIRLSKESATLEERKRSSEPPPPPDEAAARSLARSWAVEGLQTTLLENRGQVPSKQKQSPLHHHEKRPSVSKASDSSHRSPSSSQLQFQSVSSSSRSQSHSRASSQSQSRVSEPRPILKRDPATVDGSSLQSRLQPTRTSSASVAAATAAAESTQQQQKRRKASVSSHSSYPYSTSNYSYHYPYNSSNATANNNTIQQPGTSQSLKHASSREIQAGQILNPNNSSSASAVSKESSPRVPVTTLPSQGTSSASAQAAASEREKERSRSNSRRSRSSSVSQAPPPPQQPQVQAHPVYAQQHQAQVSPQHHHVSQSQGPPSPSQRDDIFAPVRFNCIKCASIVASTVLTQPSLALTSPDPFSHPFASALHVICSNPACGAVHCRGCLQAIKCRNVDSHGHSDSQALVPFSSFSATSPSRSTFLTASASSAASSANKSHRESISHTNACAGGPGCALWTCCRSVRAIAIWEALRAFDAVFGAEANFQAPEMPPPLSARRGDNSYDHSSPPAALGGRQHREAYVKMVISRSEKRKFEDAFMRTLRVVGCWLQPSPRDEEDGDDEEEDEVSRQRRRQEREAYNMLTAQIFLSSYLLEVVHTLLSHRNAKDWSYHWETYYGILELIRKITDCGLGFLLKEAPVTSPCPPPPGSASSSFYNLFAPGPLSSSSPSSASGSSSATTALSSSTFTPTQQALSLYDVVQQLESYREELKSFAGKFKFSGSLDNSNKLVEAITYLVLQQMVGDF